MVFSSAYFVSKLRLSEDISRVLPDNEKIDNMSFVFQNSKLLDKLLINISLSDSTKKTDKENLIEFSKSIVKDINEELMPDYIESIDKAPDNATIRQLYSFILHNIPVLLDNEDYTKIDLLITKQGIERTVKANYKLLIGPAGFAAKQSIQKDPLHLANFPLEKLKSFNIDDNFEVEQGFIITKDGKNLLLMLNPVSNSNTQLNKTLFSRLDKIVAKASSKGFAITYFGNAAVSYGNADRIKKDIILTVSLAFIFLLLFISFFFRKKSSFLLVFMPVIFGALVSLAFLSATVGEVSAIALGIGSVLLGISVDYAIHIMSHFRQNANIKLLYRDVSTPIIMSSLTTASAFLSLLFINSGALNDLGVFAAVSVLAAAFFSLVVLPHLMHEKSGYQSKAKKNLIDRLAALHLHDNLYLKLFVVLLTAFFFFTSSKVSFDGDMMKSNYMSKTLRDAENNLNKITSASRKSIYIVSVGKTKELALERNRKLIPLIDSLQSQGLVKSYTSVSSLLKSEKEQQMLIDKWVVFWRANGDSTIKLIEKASVVQGFKTDAFNGFRRMIHAKYDILKTAPDSGLFKKMTSNYLIETDTLVAVINVLKVESDQSSISRIYKSFDKESNVWIVDKRLVTSELVGILNNNFNILVYISLFFVFLILLLAYGRLELTILTMIPVLVSWVWTVGIMGLFGISFNIFNIIILTFIFGLGIDYSIFLMRGLLQDYKYGVKDVSSYKVSIILSAITTLAGIGVLLFAKHPALKSIALMSIIGILSVIVVNFVMLPAIFKWLVSYKKGLRNRPVTLLDFIMSLLSLLVFVGGALFMTVLAFVFKAIPADSDKKKLLYHKIFSKLTWFLIYMNFFSRKTILNPLGEDYSEASIIIANHQSHIDLMLMMLLNPKVLVLTNANNYFNPIYGKALQYADFLPSTEGYEKVLEDYKPLAAKGYSLVIFPEGHRNDKGTIKRFHKGAFFLAEKLDIPVLPILIHGQNQLLKKSEFFLKRGNITTKFLPKININKDGFGKTLKEKTLKVQGYFRDEYSKLRRMNETPDYFADYVRKNYLYKGPVLEWYTFVKLKLEDNYRIFDEIIPRNCKITDLGCGYGYLDYMLNLVSEERLITAVDYDEQKIALAANCAIRNKNVKFVATDICEFEIEDSDIIILKDVLHYLPAEKQDSLLDKCLKRLNDNGMIIIRDGDADESLGHKKTRMTEWFSTNFGFNKTEHDLEFVSGTGLRKFAENHGMKLSIVQQAKITSNKIFVLKNR
jgi:1-acyl-sn-glycerol-3-phosphate acyltransferase